MFPPKPGHLIFPSSFHQGLSVDATKSPVDAGEGPASQPTNCPTDRPTDRRTDPNQPNQTKPKARNDCAMYFHPTPPNSTPTSLVCLQITSEWFVSVSIWSPFNPIREKICRTHSDRGAVPLRGALGEPAPQLSNGSRGCLSAPFCVV